jgi:adenylate cyclase
MRLTRKKKKILIAVLISSIISLLVSICLILNIFKVFELKTVDLRQNITRSGKKTPKDIVVILIDESSLKALENVYGRWPWSRRVHADLIKYLALSGAKNIIFDILFTEKMEKSLASEDLELVYAVKDASNVTLASQMLVDNPDEFNKTLLNKSMPDKIKEKFALKVSKTDDNFLQDNNNFYMPFPELSEVANKIGVATFHPDKDGVYRQVPLIFKYQNSYYPGLSLTGALDNFSVVADLDKDLLMLKKADNLLEIPQINGKFYINMYGEYNAFSYCGVLSSYYMLMKGEIDKIIVPPETFSNKTVFIGASAAGVEDLKHTSISTTTPGVFLHISALSNIITNDFVIFIPCWVNVLIIFALSFLTSFIVFYVLNIYKSSIYPIVILLSYLSLSVLFYYLNNIVIDVFHVLLSALLSYTSSFIYLNLTEGKDKKKIKNILSQYVSPHILSQVIDKTKEDFLKAEIGTCENVTILLSDIRSFTDISENYPPEKVVEMLNFYLSKMTQIIFDNKGTLDKFIGDAILAFWGAPVKDINHPHFAVKAGLSMLKEMQNINKYFATKGLPEINIGIGINTGDVIVGNIGSEKKLDYTIIGDNVNLTARLESLNKYYSTNIIISETTYEIIKNEIKCRILDYVIVKGKTKPIKIFEPLNVDNCDKIIWYNNVGFENYIKKNWDESINYYRLVLDELKGDKVSEMFIKRCENFKNNPPPENWNGVYIYKEK